MADKTIYFAGGCFWGVEHFFKGVDGVKEATPGYANGNTDNPSYKEVYTDTTGHAETVRVRYNPERVSLYTLLKLFFTVTNPLTLNRQGHDEGTRYRSGVFYDNPEDHQDYLDKNPEGYCHLPLKTFRYLRLWQDVKLFLGDETDVVARMANISALIAGRMHFFWTGFYRVIGEQLVLGPFQGPEACFRIGFGKGVCGTAWKEARTVVVPDVEEFPGHIACSSQSKSEIVVPVFDGDKQIVAVLDIDSDEYATFDGTDAVWLEMISALTLRTA